MQRDLFFPLFLSLLVNKYPAPTHCIYGDVKLIIHMRKFIFTTSFHFLHVWSALSKWGHVCDIVKRWWHKERMRMCVCVHAVFIWKRWHRLYPACVKREAEMSAVLINIPRLLYGCTDVFVARWLQADGEM